MDLRHAAANVALTVMLCVMAMFLHPVAHGPYSAVHGPTTALRARYRSLTILVAMARAAFCLTALIAFFWRSSAALVDGTSTSSLPFRDGPDPLPLRC